MNLTVDSIKKAVLGRGFKWFNDLNIVWIRTKDETINVFNDFCTISWFEKGQWRMECFKATTDPGLYWLQNPMNVNGTAIVKEGQYIDCWAIGKHNGHLALIQVRPITVHRGRLKNGKIDIQKDQTGLFGINSHQANAQVESKLVDKWSAGCMVIASPVDQKKYMDICRLSGKKYFTLTLIHEKDLK